MIKKLFLIALLNLNYFAFSQDNTAIKYANTINQADALKHLNIIASDQFEGRETGKPGAQMAADYIQTQFKNLGLKAPIRNSYFQEIGLNEKRLAQKNVTLNGRDLIFASDFYVLPSNFKNTTKTFKNFVFVGYGISSTQYDDLSNLNLEGKVAVVFKGEPVVNGISLITGTSKFSEWTTNKSKKADALKAKKPLAIIYLDPTLKQRAQKINFEKTALYLEGNENPLTLYFTKATIEDLMGHFRKDLDSLKAQINSTLKPISFRFNANLDVDIQNKITPVPAKNVLGFLEGSDKKLKNELLVITAHYDHLGVDKEDHIFNGADDDGSGTTGVLEIAAAFAKAKKEGNGPKRSILFMTVVGEEKGLLGSDWYSQHPVFPLKNTITDLNIDMIGRVGELYKNQPDSVNYIYVIGSDKLSSTLRGINENANANYTKLKLDYLYDDPTDVNRIYYRSDHYNFAKHQIPIIFYFNGIHEDYHKITDDVKKINFPLLVKRAQLVFYTAWDLANRAERPIVDRKED